MTVNRESLRQRLIREEGLRLKPYVDTVGKITIGVGHNLTDKGITYDVAMQLLDADMEEVIQGLQLRGAPWFSGLDQVRQQVCCDMAFNLGVPGFFKFVNTIRAIQQGDFERAAAHMRASKWATQVGGRAELLATMMESGVE